MCAHFLISGKVGSLLLKIRKFLLPSVSKFDRSLDSHEAGRKLMNLQQDVTEQYSLKPTCLVGRKQSYADSVIDHVSPHQVRW